MANNTELLSLLTSKDTLAGIAKATGVSAKDVSGILTNALPALLQGATAQTASASTQNSFVNALASHAKDDTSDLASFFSKVDLKDGAKIVNHLLGNNAQAVTAAAGTNGVSAAKANSVLAAAAPLLMSVLGKNTNAASGNSSSVLSAATALLGKADVSKIANALLKNSTGIDLSDGLDAKDVAGFIKKIVK